MTLGRRVFTEKRALIVPLVAVALLNVAVYALVVYPLHAKSEGAATRAANAATSLKAAEADYASAKALVTGKAQAEQELTTFYGKVLPADQLAALRLTYGPLPVMAKKANVKVLSRHWNAESNKKDNGRLERLVVGVALEGDYEAFRRFIYDLETAPEFVIVDDVKIAMVDEKKPLVFSLELSTYYPMDAHAR